MTVATSELERVASFVTDNELAVVWSQRIDGDDPDAGKKGRSGWQLVKPQKSKDYLLAHLERYQGVRNLLVVTQPSKVITIDCDTEAGLGLYSDLGLPMTATVMSGRDGCGFHFIFRPPQEGLELTFFELAGEEEPAVTAAVRNKLHVLHGLHKSGREYILSPESFIATMPQEVYDRLAEGYGHRARAVRENVSAGAQVKHPGRHDYLLSRASDYYDYLGLRGDALAAHLRVDWDYGCEKEPPVPDIDMQIKRIVDWKERRG